MFPTTVKDDLFAKQKLKAVCPSCGNEDTFFFLLRRRLLTRLIAFSPFVLGVKIDGYATSLRLRCGPTVRTLNSIH